MAENAIDAMVLMEGTSLKYFTGDSMVGRRAHVRPGASGEGRDFYVCPGFEEGRAREQIANAPDGAQPDVRIWQEDESPYERIAASRTVA